MFLLGQTKHGMYTDDLANIHPELINQYYGVDHIQPVPGDGQTGARHPLNEEEGVDDDDLQWETIEEQVAADQASNFHNEAVAIPKHANPFESADVQEAFRVAL